MLSAEADKTCRDLDNYGYYEKTELNILYTLKVSNKHKAEFCTRVPVHWNRYKRPNNTLQLTEENAMVKKRKQRKCNGYSLVHRYTRTQLKAAMKDIVPQRIFKPRSNKVFFLSSFVVLFLLRYFWNINLSMSFLWLKLFRCCKLFVGILLGSCKRRYENQAKVMGVTEFRWITCLQKLIISPVFISRTLSCYSVLGSISTAGNQA